MRHLICVFAVSLTVLACGNKGTGSSVTEASAQPAAPKVLDTKKALAFLDARAKGWIDQKWNFVTGNTCGVSCHTTLPYMLTRSIYRDETPPEAFTKIRDFVENRVKNWDTVLPVYDFAKEASLSTEGALNGPVLALSEALAGKTELSQVAADAAAHTVEAQMQDGSWAWMQEYLAPFEDAGAQYWGSAFVARALAMLPKGPGGAEIPGLADAEARAASFLNARYDQQNLHAQMMAALAGAANPGLLTDARRQDAVKKLFDAQRCDGGWALPTLGKWYTKAGELNDPKTATSDGYSTGLALMTLAENGLSPSLKALSKARQWIEQNQADDGSWPLKSMNSPESTFNNSLITDSSTAYSLMALDSVKRHAATAPDLSYYIGVSGEKSAPAKFFYASAKTACSAAGYRLPTFAELEQVVSQNMLRCDFQAGWAWSSDKGDNVLSKKVYDFTALAADKPAASSALLASKGLLICVKAGVVDSH